MEGIMAYQSFEDLEIWKRACRLATDIYKNLKGCKDYGLKDQMTRSAVSIASNIAEGAERNSVKEYERFLHIAKGSAAELRTQIYIATRIGVLDKTASEKLVEETKAISAKTQVFINKLRSG
jgi:four helix bundle protein